MLLVAATLVPLSHTLLAVAMGAVVATSSTLVSPAVTAVRSPADGAVLCELTTPAEPAEAAKWAAALPPPELVTVPTRDGAELMRVTPHRVRRIDVLRHQAVAGVERQQQRRVTLP